MFVILLKYLKPLFEVEKHVAEHRAFLDQHYAAGTLLASGPQVPRTGGLILARGASRADLEKMIHDDPFHKAGIAQYEIIEFEPVKHAPGFKDLL